MKAIENNQIIIVAGPTASGKTGFAIKLASEIGAEIINVDSLQVYKENPIISAQPTKEEQQGIKHHLLGYVNGDEIYNIHRWINDSRLIIDNAKKPIIIVGGTGFFIKHLMFGFCDVPEINDEVRLDVRNLFKELGAEAFYKKLQELDPEGALKLDYNNSHRTMRALEVIKATGKPLSYWQKNNMTYYYPLDRFKMYVLSPPRDLLYRNINQRFIDMLNNGVLDEVSYILKQNFNPDTGIMKSHGIPELAKYINGEWSLEYATEKSQQVVRNYAKRQTTWFKHQFHHPELDLKFLYN
jgi:tRNA dimethylallyltransferase